MLLNFLSGQTEFEHLVLVSAHIRLNTLSVFSQKYHFNIYNINFEVGCKMKYVWWEMRISLYVFECQIVWDATSSTVFFGKLKIYSSY